jgi:hypothetical protein
VGELGQGERGGGEKILELLAAQDIAGLGLDDLEVLSGKVFVGNERVVLLLLLF